MNQKSKLLQITALGMMISAIALTSVEIIPTARGSYAPVTVD